MPRVVTVQPLQRFRLQVEFSDGVSGAVDLSTRLFGPVFEPLREWETFRQVFVDEFGVMAWPNGADVAPDALHTKLKANAEIAAT